MKAVDSDYRVNWSDIESVAARQPATSAIRLRQGKRTIQFDFPPMGLSLPTAILLLVGAVGITVFWSKAAAFLGLIQIDADYSSIKTGVQFFTLAVVSLVLGICLTLGRYQISVTPDDILKNLYFVGIRVFSYPMPKKTIHAIEKHVEVGNDFQIRLCVNSDDDQWVVIEGFKTEGERDWLFCYLESVLSDDCRS